MPSLGAHLCPETHCGPGRGLPHGRDGGLCRVCLGLGGELRERTVMSELPVKVVWASWVIGFNSSSSPNVPVISLATLTLFC